MRETLGLGSTPCNEDCVQVSKTEEYETAMRNEAQRFVDGLRKHFADIKPEGCRFLIKWYPHDFGRYAEVEVTYDDMTREEAEFAYFVESNTPQTWYELENTSVDIEKFERYKEGDES